MIQNNVINPIFTIGQVLNTAVSSSAITMNNCTSYCIQIFWSGTPTGQFDLWVSTDPLNSTPSHWTIYSNTTQAATAANSSTGYNYQAIPGFNWVQVRYTDGSGGSSTAAITLAQVSFRGLE